ncbi:hypothetical protein ACFZ8E_07415 [Methylobacterium sp. HMF5984]|uniref:hypothetical protein n=1 Tax=Methylobacterium sp. HMF5984 TaxID=3367370 RepID=UPI003852DD79
MRRIIPLALVLSLLPTFSQACVLMSDDPDAELCDGVISRGGSSHYLRDLHGERRYRKELRDRAGDVPMIPQGQSFNLFDGRTIYSGQVNP